MTGNCNQQYSSKLNISTLDLFFFLRIYGSSRTFFTLERAAKLITLENEPFSNDRHVRQLEKLNKYVEPVRINKVFDLEEVNLKKMQRATESVEVNLNKMEKVCTKILSMSKLVSSYFSYKNQFKYNYKIFFLEKYVCSQV